jgi:hypothetical protein
MEIDNRLQASAHPEYDFESTANEYTAFFKSNINQPRSICFYLQEATCYFTPAGLGYYDASTDRLVVLEQPKDTACTQADHMITFTGLYENTTAKFVISADGFKEYFFVNDIHSIPSPLAYDLDPASTYLVLMNHIEYDGVDMVDRHGEIAERELDKTVHFLKDGLPHFFHPNLVGIDPKTNKTTDLKKIFKVVDGKDCLIHGIDYSTLMKSKTSSYIIDTNVTVNNDLGSDLTQLGVLQYGQMITPAGLSAIAAFDGTIYSFNMYIGHTGWANDDCTDNDSSASYDVAIRFPSVTIPKGANVTSAVLTFTAGLLSGTTVDPDAVLGSYADFLVYGYNVPIGCEDSGNSSAFTSNGPRDRTMVTATPTYQLGMDGSYTTIDLAGSVKHVVNRSDWVSGNAISVITNSSALDAIGEGQALLAGNASSPSPLSPCTLSITYSAGGATSSLFFAQG